MALDMAVDTQSALGAATRPEDSPHNWKEAMRRHDSDKWIQAAQAEIDALTTNGTWHQEKPFPPMGVSGVSGTPMGVPELSGHQSPWEPLRAKSIPGSNSGMPWDALGDPERNQCS